MWLWRLISSRICIWQAGDPRRAHVSVFSLNPKAGKAWGPRSKQSSSRSSAHWERSTHIKNVIALLSLLIWFKCYYCCSAAQSCLILCDPMDCSTPGFPVLHHIPEPAQPHVHWVSDAIQPSLPVTPFFSCLQSFPASGFFPNKSALCIRWPKYWSFSFSFSFSISPSNEYSGLISFRIDWLDLLAVQGTLKSFQHHSSKASILWHSSFFRVQLTSIRDYQKNKSFDYSDLCWQSNVSAF